MSNIIGSIYQSPYQNYMRNNITLPKVGGGNLSGTAALDNLKRSMEEVSSKRFQSSLNEALTKDANVKQLKTTANHLRLSSNEEGLTDSLRASINQYNKLSDFVKSPVTGNTYEAMGISTDAKGKLTFDEIKFKEAFTQDAQAVKKQLTEKGGFAEKLAENANKAASEGRQNMISTITNKNFTYGYDGSSQFMNSYNYVGNLLNIAR